MLKVFESNSGSLKSNTIPTLHKAQTEFLSQTNAKHKKFGEGHKMYISLRSTTFICNIFQNGNIL
jgi:hypothetical protein